MTTAAPGQCARYALLARSGKWTNRNRKRMSSDGINDEGVKVNDALRQNLTKEMFAEVEETFLMACEPSGILSAAKLPLALKALGMSLHHIEDNKNYSNGVDLDGFIEIIMACTKQPNWAVNEMNETFSIIDKDKSGNIDPQELRRIFARLGENLMETEVADQVREFDIDGDYEMALAEFYKMIASTRGSDFIFDDNLG